MTAVVGKKLKIWQANDGRCRPSLRQLGEKSFLQNTKHTQ